MSKKYKGAKCVYCAVRPSTTADHVVAREFFLVKHRGNLPKAPACAKCNADKSAIEHYLTAVLPFGGRHADAAASLGTMVPKRLEKNARLLRRLREGFAGDKVPLDPGNIERLCALIAKGLLWHHWRQILGPEDRALATGWKAEGEEEVRSAILSKLGVRDSVRADLGEGSFVYEGYQAAGDLRYSVWLFRFYGGLQFADHQSDPDGRHSLILARTVPRAYDPRQPDARGAEPEATT